jgi:Tol biopolymer transport system component
VNSRAFGSVVVLVWIAALTVCAAGSSRGSAGPSGEVVFVSDRATANPGEVYSLAVGAKPRDVTNTPAVETGLALAPHGDRIAYWSNRGGGWQLFVARADGSSAHALCSPRGNVYPVGPPPQFSADGARLLATYQLQSTGVQQVAVVDARSGGVRRLSRLCQGSVSWAPDGRVLACAGPAHVRELDVATARTLAEVPGSSAAWSSSGRLAVGGPSGTTVVDERGQLGAHVRGQLDAWSPNGRMLAVTSPGKIMVVVPGGRTLLTVSGSGYWVSFTGDSRWLGYSGAKGLRLASVNGTTSYPLRDGYGIWSSDGRYAFLRGIAPHDVLVEIADQFDRHSTVVGRFDLDDHGDSRLVWSPAGHALFYEWGARSHRDLWAIEADGSGLRRLTATGNDITTPAWSRDGRRLAYGSSGFAGGNAGFSSPKVVIATAGGRATATIQSGYEGYSPSWSPDGGRLAVANGFGGELDSVGADGRGRRQLVANGRSPAWSPDGSTIAYCAADGVRGVDPTGSNDRLLVAASGPFAPVAVAWSPDGTTLAYTNARGVFVTAADRSGAHRLVERADEAGSVSFSPDGGSLVYAADALILPRQRDLFVVRVDGTGFRPLAPSPYDDGDPAWRPAP